MPSPGSGLREDTEESWGATSWGATCSPPGRELLVLDGDMPRPWRQPVRVSQQQDTDFFQRCQPRGFALPPGWRKVTASWWPCCSADLGCPKVRPWLETALQVLWVLRPKFTFSDWLYRIAVLTGVRGHHAVWTRLMTQPTNTPSVTAAALLELLLALGPPGPFTRRFQSCFRLCPKS